MAASSIVCSPVHGASPPQAVLGPAFTPGTLVALTVPQPGSPGFSLLGLSCFVVFRRDPLQTRRRAHDVPSDYERRLKPGTEKSRERD